MSAHCRSCDAAITWAQFDSGKRAPFEEDDAGMWLLFDQGRDGLVAERYSEKRIDHRGEQRWTCHFATCPHGKQWRKEVAP